MDDYLPPLTAPPLLSKEQLGHLVEDGFLHMQLAPSLERLHDDLCAAASVYFQQPTGTKSGLYPQGHGTELGFYSISGEKDYLTLRHRCHSSQLEELAGKFWHQSGALLQRVLCDLGRLLNIKEEAWTPLLDGCLSLPPNLEETTPTLLRLFRYRPNDGFAEEHVDLGLVTLCIGKGRGLQVFKHHCSEDVGRWEDVQGPVILVGKTLRLLSSNRVAAGLHRVVGNPEGRSSIVFALRSSTRRDIGLTPFGGWGLVSGKELWDLVRDGRLNVNATPEIRERQRLELEQRKLRASPTPTGQA